MAASPEWAALFTFDGKALAWMLIGYGFVAAVLPVWLLLAPRDYLSTFLKIGTVLLLALAILFAAPDLQMPAVTQFIDGTGVEAFLQRADELAAKHGAGFAVDAKVREAIEKFRPVY